MGVTATEVVPLDRWCLVWVMATEVVSLDRWVVFVGYGNSDCLKRFLWTSRLFILEVGCISTEVCG